MNMVAERLIASKGDNSPTLELLADKGRMEN